LESHRGDAEVTAVGLGSPMFRGGVFGVSSKPAHPMLEQAMAAIPAIPAKVATAENDVIESGRAGARTRRWYNVARDHAPFLRGACLRFDRSLA
jgi:hypothetical protein